MNDLPDKPAPPEAARLIDEGPASRRQTTNLDNVSVVLVSPQHSGNIGAAARAMKNMGVKRLALVRPHAPINELSMQMARGAAHILRDSKDVSVLSEALEGEQITVATSARTGKQRRDALSPRDVAAILAPLTLQNRIALVFGPERTGLPNEIMQRCQWLVHIPTSRQFRSLNLAQAVLILCYEMYSASFPPVSKRRPLATQEQLDGMFGHMGKTLMQIGFLDPQNPDLMLMVLRRILARAGLDRREVSIIRGIMRQIDWYRRAGAPLESDP